MSFFSQIQATYDGQTVDAFGRLRISSPFTILGLKQLYDADPLFYDNQETSGSGTGSTFSADRASTTLTVSNLTAGTRVKQSKVRGVYQPAKGFLFLGTAAGFTSGAGITKRLGYFDDDNGLFFEHADGVASVVRRTHVSGSPVDVAVAQSNWNVDKMDGTGPSGLTIDFDKTQIYAIDFEWLGVGRVRMGLNVNGTTFTCHEFMNGNNLDAVYISNPNLPIRYEIHNDGTGAADSLETICASIMSEGGEEDVSRSTHISRNGTSITLGAEDTFTPILSIRLKAGRGATKVNPIAVDVFSTSATNYEWALLLNPTIAGTDNASWVDIPNSSLQYDISRNNTNLVTGGYNMAGGYGSSTVQNRARAVGSVKSFLTLGTFIDGSVDELVLAVSNINGAGGTLYGGVTVGEYF